MSATIISGKVIADEIRKEITDSVNEVKQKTNKVPGIAVVLVGENPASQVYVRMKEKACEQVGITSFEHKLPKETTQEELCNLIDKLNNQEDVNGILVQLPLPSQINEDVILNRINPEKDVDGFHPVNVGRLMTGQDTFFPCTPYGVQEMLIRSGHSPSGKNVVVVGRSNIVGKPVAMILVQKNDKANSTVTICHSRTKNLKEVTKSADILIAAIGQPEFIKADMVSEDAVVIDVGVNRVDDPTSDKGYKLVGDVAFDEVKEKVKAITPVPGGVGPMTITMLLFNTLKAFKHKEGLN